MKRPWIVRMTIVILCFPFLCIGLIACFAHLGFELGYTNTMKWIAKD